MACIENIPPINGDSEMEEGEIVDDLDDLSDISSEEEFLLRQRLQVLENYNNVLERKKAKNSTVRSGKTGKRFDLLPQDLSEISGTDNEDVFPQITINRNNSQRYCKSKKRKQPVIIHIGKNKETPQSKKKSHRIKKKLMPKIVYSSEESDDEYRNKRRKLANAVIVHTPKSDTTTLRARLKKMFGTQSEQPVKSMVSEKPKLEITYDMSVNLVKKSKDTEVTNNEDAPTSETKLDNSETKVCELVDLCNENTNDDDVTVVDNEDKSYDVVDAVEKKGSVETKVSSGDSDEDLELLRQHALKTKASKAKVDTLNTEPKEKEEELEKQLLASEDEDSDTAELRMICLKSALLKKAIEMKQKQKMRKRLSQSFHDDFRLEDELSQRIEAENNTDVELVDMDIGSDGDEKLKELSDNCDLNIKHVTEFQNDLNMLANIPTPKSPQKDEIDEDEDLLRAKLLTSLSKNWRNLVEPPVIEQFPDVPSPDVPPTTAKSKINLPVEKPFIIKLGDSDSEGEHEATKNLTKMHIKLSEQVDFQQKLDMFLKSTRMEVEKSSTLPDVVQQPAVEQPKPAPKYVAKTVRHLPKSEQIEYKNLVKRMAELEKIKQARQTSMNLMKASVPAKDTLKPRNISVDTSENNNKLEEQIALSRKKIAEESAKMLKLKDEAVKLSRKYKIVASELKNLTTAITFNKKEQRSVQTRLAKIRLQHQNLLKSSTSSKHSINNLPFALRTSDKNMSSTKLQKENDPSKEEYKNPQLLKSVKVSIVNNLKEDSVSCPRLSVQVDVSSNKKIVKMPKSPTKERVVDVESVDGKETIIEQIDRILGEDAEGKNPKQGNERLVENRLERQNIEHDDYKSPLEALQTGNWEEDPNSFLCPFEVGGSCKDPDCKYLHPKVPSDQ